MTGRLRRTLAALGSLVLTACGTGPGPAGGPPERIVLIVIDTLRRDHVSAYGGVVDTPNLDALAARGRAVEDALASFHQTTMSMAALFTGRTPSLELAGGERLFWNARSWCGLHRLTSETDTTCLPASVPTLAESLRDAGYHTIGVASNHFLFAPGGYERGFDDWTEVGDRAPAPSDDAPADLSTLPWWQPVNRAAVAALARRAGDRFFLYVHYMDVHDYLKRQVPYADAVRAVDRGVGALLGALEDEGLLDSATVVLTSDHGERLGEAHPAPGREGHLGNPSYMELLRVPLIVAPAPPEDVLPADRIVRGEDVFDLVRRIAGLGAAGPPGPEAGELDPGEVFVSEAYFRTLLRGRWKASLRRADGRMLLFDLEKDPHERRDVSARHPKVSALMRARAARLSSRLAAPRGVEPTLPPEDRERLRILGYLEPEPDRGD